MIDSNRQDRARKGPVLEIKSVSKSYGGVQALSDVSISVNAGEILCLVGENGAGKSTFIKALANQIACFVEIDEGQILDHWPAKISDGWE